MFQFVERINKLMANLVTASKHTKLVCNVSVSVWRLKVSYRSPMLLDQWRAGAAIVEVFDCVSRTELSRLLEAVAVRTTVARSPASTDQRCRTSCCDRLAPAAPFHTWRNPPDLSPNCWGHATGSVTPQVRDSVSIGTNYG